MDQLIVQHQGGFAILCCFSVGFRALPPDHTNNHSTNQIESERAFLPIGALGVGADKNSHPASRHLHRGVSIHSIQMNIHFLLGYITGPLPQSLTSQGYSQPSAKMRLFAIFPLVLMSLSSAANALYCCHYATTTDCPSPISPIAKRILVNPSPREAETCCTCYASGDTADTCPTPHI
ncbi:hypothetical protein DL93DRAFT_2079081, partial [Clavulina sp. PMI_390]